MQTKPQARGFGFKTKCHKPQKTAGAQPPVNNPTTTAQPSAFDALPGDSYLRLSQLVRSASNPNALLPCSSGTLWRWVRAGQFPSPKKLSERMTVWRVGDIRAWMAGVNAKG